MKVKRFILVLLIIAFIGAVVVVVSHPKEQVFVSVRSIETNEVGDLFAVVLITNVGPDALSFSVAVQTKGVSGWAPPRTIESYYGDSEGGELRPSSERVFSLPLSSTGEPWRVVVLCNPPVRGLSKGIDVVYAVGFDKDGRVTMKAVGGT